MNCLEAPGAITGTNVLCQGVSTVAYEVPIIANAASYEWFLPFGASIESGAGSRYIIVNFAQDAMGGNITVRGRNACGTGLESAPLPITVNPLPTADAGFDQSVCSASSILQANNNPNGKWTLLSGYATFDDVYVHNTGISNLEKGDNVLYVDRDRKQL